MYSNSQASGSRTKTPAGPNPLEPPALAKRLRRLPKPPLRVQDGSFPSRSEVRRRSGLRSEARTCCARCLRPNPADCRWARFGAGACPAALAAVEAPHLGFTQQRLRKRSGEGVGWRAVQTQHCARSPAPVPHCRQGEPCSLLGLLPCLSCLLPEVTPPRWGMGGLFRGSAWLLHACLRQRAALSFSSPSCRPPLCRSHRRGVCLSLQAASASASMQVFQYPEVYREETSMHDYHGCKICDPYSWLEDPDSEQTKAFVEAQNKITVPFLEQCTARGLFKERMTELYDYPKYSCHFKKGKRYFHFYNSGLQNQRVLYVQDSLEADAKVFLDPNKLSDDGTVALRGYAFSEDGEYFAYGLSSSGSDWVTIKFMKVDGATELPDTLEMVKFSCMSWTHDGKGMFYNCYPKQDGKSDGTETSTNLHQKLYYHVLGTDQSKDVLCAEFPHEPKWMGGAEVSDDGQYVLLSIRQGCDPVNRLWYCDLQKESNGITGILQWVKLIDNFDAEYEYVTNEGTTFTFKTNNQAPNYRLINIDFSDPEESKWKVLIPEHGRDVLEWVACVRSNFLVLCYLHDVKNVLQLHDLATGAHLKTFPLDVGSIVGYSGQKKDSEIFYQFTSFLSPGIIYHCDLTKEELEPRVFREVTVKGFDPSAYQTVQVFYPSKDGTKIPMFIVHKKGIKLDGSLPAFLYGYGGFNISITPSYSVSRLIFIRHLGGILAVANIRGGGEYGETWHKGGILANKQNCFDDFQCAAEYLVKEGYTSPKKLTINGGSNGGLLVAACANQRPDLFGCVIAQVGVMDMLKFHKYTIGHAWTTDFGCSDYKEQFEWLYKYSPLHNIKLPEGDGVQYPATLLLTADHDDRVVPLHSLKFIATLQYVVGPSAKQTNPLLIHVDTKAGHGAGKPTAKVIEEASDMFAFIARCLNLEWIE